MALYDPFNLISFPSHARLLFSHLIAMTLTSISQSEWQYHSLYSHEATCFPAEQMITLELKKHLSSEKIS